MGWFSEVALSNAVVASLLALVAWCVTRTVHRPALVHSLWLLVLLKLVTPPIIPLKLAILAPAELPPAATAAPTDSQPSGNAVGFRQQVFASASPSGATNGVRPSAPAGASGRATRDTEASALPGVSKTKAFNNVWRRIAAIPPWFALHSQWLLAGWAVGSGAWIFLTLVRISRQRRMLRLAAPAPLWLQLEADGLAGKIGLGNRLRLWLMPAPVSPMIWSFGGTTRLLFPRSLIARLTPAGRQTLLMHELAHLRRHDHWVRWLEITATCIFWWHPAVWLARRELHVAEEECCDAWVVATLPDRARAYAEALLETIDFLSSARPSLPVAASGLGAVGCLKRRLANILGGATFGRLTPLNRAGVVAIGIVILSVLPTLAHVRSPRIAVSSQGERKGRIAAASQPGRDIEAAGAPVASADAHVGRRDYAGSAAFNETQAPWEIQSGLTSRGDRSEFGVPAVISHSPGFACNVMAFSPDGRTLTVGSPSGAARVDIASGEFLPPLTSLDRARAIAYAPDGRSIFLADRDHVVREIHAETGEPIRAFGRHTGEVLDVVVSRDGRRLATAGVDGTVRVWSVNGSRKPLTFRRHADRVEAISFSADGRTIASISRDGTAYLWRTVDGAVQRVLGGSHRTPTYQAQSLQRRDTPSAPLPPVVSGSTFMGAVRSPSSAAHAASLATVDRASNRSEPPVACGSSFSVAFSPDGSIIATAGWNRSVQLWDARDGNLLGQLTAERGCITCLGFSPEGDQLATGGLEGDLILWDVSRRRVSCTVKAHAGPVGSIAFSPSGAWIASAAPDGMSKLWSVPRTIAQ